MSWVFIYTIYSTFCHYPRSLIITILNNATLAFIDRIYLASLCAPTSFVQCIHSMRFDVLVQSWTGEIAAMIWALTETGFKWVVCTENF
jgi:hypothetical protein